MNPLIFNPGRNWVKRKPIERMFPKLGNSIGKGEYGVCLSCQTPRYTAEMFNENECRDCRKRNAKKEKKECTSSGSLSGVYPDTYQFSNLQSDLKTTSTEMENGSSSKKSPSSPSVSEPEFKVGDLVEIESFSGVYKIESFEYPCNLAGKWAKCDNISVLVSRLRHAETEPQESDGWKEIDNIESGVTRWRHPEYQVIHRNMNASHVSRIWFNTKIGQEASSWPELKRKIEEQK